MKIRALLFLFFIPFFCKAQETVSFTASDGLTVTANLYLRDKTLPFIILLHQANYSRGEYIETAPRLTKLGFNCLAVDLRSGGEVNYVPNKTAALAIDKKLPNFYLDAEKDIQAAMDYVKTINTRPVILFGSSYSASLVLKMAKFNRNVHAVVAFSPGEYFGTKLTLKPLLTRMDKPLFVACTKTEAPYVETMLEDVPGKLITWWQPSKTEGIHGSRMLWKESPESDNCWMTLLLFFKNLQKQYPEPTF
jgi:dienelactone hydrolase